MWTVDAVFIENDRFELYPLWKALNKAPHLLQCSFIILRLLLLFIISIKSVHSMNGALSPTPLAVNRPPASVSMRSSIRRPWKVIVLWNEVGGVISPTLKWQKIVPMKSFAPNAATGATSSVGESVSVRCYKTLYKYWSRPVDRLFLGDSVRRVNRRPSAVVNGIANCGCRSTLCRCPRMDIVASMFITVRAESLRT